MKSLKSIIDSLPTDQKCPTDEESENFAMQEMLKKCLINPMADYRAIQNCMKQTGIMMIDELKEI